MGLAVPVSELNDVELATTLLKLTQDALASDAMLQRLEQYIDELRAAARLTPAVVDGRALPVCAMQGRRERSVGDLQSVIWNQAALSPLLAAVMPTNNGSAADAVRRATASTKLLIGAGADVNQRVCGVAAVDRASMPEIILCLLDVPALDLSKSVVLHSLCAGWAP
jgi:hypothetical protein